MGRQDIYRSARLNPHYPTALSAVYWDAVPMGQRARIRLEIVATTDARPQAVLLGVNVGKGCVSVDDSTGRGLWLWVTSGMSLLIDVEASEGILNVDHGWRLVGVDGAPGHALMGTDYSAMLVEVEGKRRTYRCNNGRLGDDFSELVFSLDLLDES